MAPETVPGAPIAEPIGDIAPRSIPEDSATNGGDRAEAVAKDRTEEALAPLAQGVRFGFLARLALCRSDGASPAGHENNLALRRKNRDYEKLSTSAEAVSGLRRYASAAG
jgi:hypothetical protein